MCEYPRQQTLKLYHNLSRSSPTVRNRLSQMRRKAGDIRSLQACIDIGFPSWEDFHATAIDVSEVLQDLNPDMGELVEEVEQNIRF